MAATAYKLSKAEKERLARRINYYRTVPRQILTTATNLETFTKVIQNDFVDHRARSVLVGGRIMILNINQ